MCGPELWYKLDSQLWQFSCVEVRAFVGEQRVPENWHENAKEPARQPEAFFVIKADVPLLSEEINLHFLKIL